MGHHSSHGRSDGSRIHGPRTEEFRDGLREGSRQIRNLATKRHKNHSAATPQPNVNDVAGWTELECVIFPSSQRRGGCAIKKMPRSHKSGVDGVVSSAGLRRRAELTTPSATNRNGSIVFDVADTPSARRGMCYPENFVQKTKSCSLVTQKNPTFFCLLWLR